MASLHLLIAGIFVIDLLRQHRSPAATSAWMAILLLLPYAGIALYFLGHAPRKRGSGLAEFLRLHVYEPPGATIGNRVRVCSRNEHAAQELLALIHSTRKLPAGDRRTQLRSRFPLGIGNPNGHFCQWEGTSARVLSGCWRRAGTEVRCCG